MKEFSTEIRAGKDQKPKGRGSAIDENAQMKQALLCFEQDEDIEGSAFEQGALLRHRGVQHARDLLRIALAYSVLDYSLRTLGAWCVVVGLVDLSKTALLKRLRKCHRWLGYLIGRVLIQHKISLPAAMGLRIKLIDATVVSKPGSQGTDWRLHVGFDLGHASLDWVEITDGKGSEDLNRFKFTASDLCIADRAYALQRQIGSVLAQKAWLMVRMGWFRQPGLLQEDGQAFDIIAWLKKNKTAIPGLPFEAPVWISIPPQSVPLRLIARQIPEEQAEEARRRLRKEASKKGRTIDERSLLAAGFVMVITNLPPSTYPASQVLKLYRFRWQIELAFKRLKSLSNLDHLRAKDHQLALSYLYAKILGALLLDRFILLARSRCPTWFLSLDHPVSLWRLTAFLWEQVRFLIRGHFSLPMILDVLPRLQRFVCDEPRKRTSQFVAAQVFSKAFACP